MRRSVAWRRAGRRERRMNMSRWATWCMGVLTIASVVPAIAADDMVRVPAGSFVMGSARSDAGKQAQEYGSAKPWYVDEKPQHEVKLPPFWIDKYEVTNAQYRELVRKTNYWVPPSWGDNVFLIDRYLLKTADLATLRRLASDTFIIPSIPE